MAMPTNTNLTVSDPVQQAKLRRVKESLKAYQLRVAAAKRRLKAIRKETSRQLAWKRYTEQREIKKKQREARIREKEARLVKKRLMKSLAEKRLNPVAADLETKLYDHMTKASLARLAMARKKEIEMLHSLYNKLVAEGRRADYEALMTKLKNIPRDAE